MKKLFYPLFALAALAMTNTSCQDELENGTSANGNEVAVSFKVELENAVGSRAVGDGTTAKELHYYVYKADKATTDRTIGDEIAALRGTTTVKDDLTAEVKFTLVKGQTYNFMFWAQCVGGSKYYTLNPETGKVNIIYQDNAETTDVNEALNANDENRDAFFKVRKDLKVDGPINETITLKRPFAQINVGTEIGSLAAAAKAETEIATASFVVKNVSDELDLYTGAAAEYTADKQITFTFNKAAIMESDKTDNVGDLKNVAEKDYEYLAMNYILVPDAEDNNTGDAYGVGEEKGLVDADFEIFDASGASVNKLEIPNIPVQRNFRTNIIGEILNASVTFNVIIDPNFDNDHNYVTNEQLAFVLQNGGEYTLTGSEKVEGNLVVSAESSATLNLNGKTLDLASYRIINNGRLTVNGPGTITTTGTHAIENIGQLTLNQVTVDGYVYSNDKDYTSVPGEVDGKEPKMTLDINGCTIDNDGGYAVSVVSYGKVDIKNTTVNGGISISSAIATISRTTAIATKDNVYGLHAYCAIVDYADDCVFGGKVHDIYIQIADEADATYKYNSIINGKLYSKDATDYTGSGYLLDMVAADETELAALIKQGGIVALNADVTLTSALVVDNAATLNLNGKTLTLQAAVTVADANSAIKYGLKNTGNLKVLGGKINYTEGQGYSRNAAVYNAGVLELTDVELTSDVFAIYSLGTWDNDKILQEQGAATVKTIINGGVVKSTATAHKDSGEHIYAIYALDNSLVDITNAKLEGDGGISINCANAKLNKVDMTVNCKTTYGFYMIGAANVSTTDCTYSFTASESAKVKAYAFNGSNGKYGKIIYNNTTYATTGIVEQ